MASKTVIRPISGKERIFYRSCDNGARVVVSCVVLFCCPTVILLATVCNNYSRTTALLTGPLQIDFFLLNYR